VCPLGTLQDWLASLARRLGGEKSRARGKRSKARFPIQVPPRIGKWLRYLKYLVLAAILVTSTMTVYPPLRAICPALAIFSFHWSTLLLGVVLVIFVLSSMFIKRFTCRYLCPLGAALAITNKVSLIRIAIDQNSCTSCGRCDNECPVDIPAIPENTRSAECVRCLECLETCEVSDTIDLKIG
ncbi:MAG: 4Fe-4S binding protein, partial [Spirochaetales bacterium]|nr:4Fe-4S binding protein [Spirochaetales bacterium]